MMHGARFAFLLRRGAHRKAVFLEFDIRVFAVANMGIRGQVLLVQRLVQFREHSMRVDEGL
jgi:hypothetical protein